MSEAPPAVPKDKLDRITALTARVRDIDAEMSGLGERTKKLKNERTEIATKKLPELFQQVGMSSVALQAEGNAPAYAANMAKFYNANISADWPDEQREKAFALLTKLGMADIIKNIITIELGKGTAKLQKAVVAALRKLKVPFSAKRGVPHQTLTAWIRDRYAKNEPLSQEELTILGATVGIAVSLKEVKEKS